MSNKSNKTWRWKVTFNYQYAHDKFNENEVVFINEMEELQEIVELGQDWRTIKNIIIEHNDEKFEKMTEEELLADLNFMYGLH